MRKTLTSRLLLLLLLGLLFIPATVHGQAIIVIINNDGAGEGFNDPTPTAPIGGNTGTTLGQQRLISFQHAASIWGSTVASNVPILIRAQFNPLTCTATGAVLGSAGAIGVAANMPPNGSFPGSEFVDTWYPYALANKRSGFDIDPTNPDISATFNSSIGTAGPGCLGGIGWYYGLDGNHGTSIDLIAVLLHEFAHGLGFQQFANIANGLNFNNRTDVYARKLYDKTLAKTWDQMTNAERVASAKNYRKVVWIGPSVTSAVPLVLEPGTPLLTVNSPAPIADAYPVGAAAFGPPLSSPGVTADIVQALDDTLGLGPTTFDGCSPLTNAAAIAGKLAMIDRGGCTFNVKVANAQAAGAVGVIIANNVAGSTPPGLGGVVDPTILIPAVGISLPVANLIKPLLGGGVSATLGINLAIRNGADELGRALMYTPDPIVSGSSVSHWDTSAFKNLLMEPNINGDLTHNLTPPDDITLAHLRDIGWYPDADVDGIPDGNDTCDLNITNTTLPSGTPLTQYSQQLNVLPAGSYTFSLVQGSLPAGITLNPTTGLLSGQLLAPGIYNFSVKAQQPSGCFFIRALSITVSCATIVLNPVSLPGGQKGSLYNQAITATPGGTYQYSFTGNLPPGLSLSTSGFLIGIPTADGTFNFTVIATGAFGCAGSRAYSIVIAPAACPTITVGSLPNGKVGSPYMGYASASPTARYTWAVTAGAVPPGLTFYPAVGLLFGYPTTAGPFSFTLTATNVNACPGSASQSVTIAP